MWHMLFGDAFSHGTPQSRALLRGRSISAAYAASDEPLKTYAT